MLKERLAGKLRRNVLTTEEQCRQLPRVLLDVLNHCVLTTEATERLYVAELGHLLGFDMMEEDICYFGWKQAQANMWHLIAF